jgi:hypothetical protein
MARLIDLNFKRGLNVFTQGNPEKTWPHVLQTKSILENNNMASTPVIITTTRPNDTAAYAVGDVIGSSTSTTAAAKLTSIGPTGSVIRITGSRHEIDVTAVPTVTSGTWGFRLHVYSAEPPSAFVDNASWDLAVGDRPYYLGYVDLGAPVDVGSTLYIQQTGLDYDFELTTADLWCYHVTNAAYTPTALAIKTTKLYAMAM